MSRVEYRWSNDQAREICDQLRKLIQDIYAKTAEGLQERLLPSDRGAAVRIISDAQRAARAAAEPFVREIVHLESVFRYPVIFLEGDAIPGA